MTENQLSEQIANLDDQEKSKEVYTEFRSFIEGVICENHANDNPKVMQNLLEKILAHTLLSERKKRKLLVLLYKNGYFKILDAWQISCMLLEHPRYSYYFFCESSAEGQEADVKSCELLNRKRLSLLFTTGESQTTFEDITFNRGGGIFEYDFSSVKNSYLSWEAKEKALVKQASFLGFFSRKEIAEILKTVSGLMQASSQEDNRMVRLLTERGGLHAEGLLLFEDLFLRINRGIRDCSQKPGITIFRHISRKQEDRDYISEIESRKADIILGVELDQKIDRMGLKFMAVVEMKLQSMRNCTLATSKALVLAAYYVAIRKILSERIPLLTDKNLHNRSAALARKIYKEFTRFYRLEEAKAYLEWSEIHQYKYIDDKILAKIIGCFGTEPSIKGIVLNHKLLDRLSLDALVFAIQTAISKENLSLIQELMNKLQLLNGALTDLLRKAINFLDYTEKKITWLSSDEELSKFKIQQLGKINELTSAFDASFQTIMVAKIDKIFNERAQKSYPATMYPQFDSCRHRAHYRPLESPKDTRPSYSRP